MLLACQPGKRTIVRIYPTPEPESPGCSCCQHRTNVRITDAAGPKPEHFCQKPLGPGRPNHRNPNILEASSTEPSWPEHKKTRTIRRLPRSLPPSARGNGVICPIMGLFIILCYLSHIICSWGDIFHSAFCHTFKLVKFLKHLLPIHRVHIFVHNVAFINK